MQIHKRFSQELPKLTHREPIRHHVFVDTESNWSQVTGERPITRHKLRFGYAKYCIWNGEQLNTHSELVFHSRQEFWTWLHSIRSKDRVWIWAHNIAFDGTMLGLWEQLQKDECKLIHFTDCDLPAFFQAQICGRSFQFLDSLNIFKASLSALGKELGKPKMDMPTQAASLTEWIPYCKNDVDILQMVVEYWIKFLTLHQLGKMSP